MRTQRAKRIPHHDNSPVRKKFGCGCWFLYDGLVKELMEVEFCDKHTSLFLLNIMNAQEAKRKKEEERKKKEEEKQKEEDGQELSGDSDPTSQEHN